MRYFYILILFVLVISFTFSGCAEDIYETYTGNQDKIQFSFEYPTNYCTHQQTEMGDVLLVQDEDDCSDQFIHDVRIVWDYYPDPHIHIHMFRVYQGIKDASTSLEYFFSNLGSKSYIINLQFIDEGSLKISGLEAEYVNYKYTCNGTSTNYYDIGTLKRPVVYKGKCASFFFEGYICNINILYSEDESKKAETEFNHLIETFKILE